MQLSSGRKGEGLCILEYFADVLHKSLLPHIFSVLPLQMQADWNQKRQNMCLSIILIKQRMQTKMHFSQENLLIYFLISNLCLGTMHFQGLTSEVSLFLPVSTCWSQNLQRHFIKCRTKQKMNNSCLSSVPIKTLHKSNRDKVKSKIVILFCDIDKFRLGGAIQRSCGPTSWPSRTAFDIRLGYPGPCPGKFLKFQRMEISPPV